MKELADHYAALDVAQAATEEEVRKAYHRTALDTHPDKWPGDEVKAERFRRAADAWAVLSNPSTRAAYDLQRAVAQAVAAARATPEPRTEYSAGVQAPDAGVRRVDLGWGARSPFTYAVLYRERGNGATRMAPGLPSQDEALAKARELRRRGHMILRIVLSR